MQYPEERWVVPEGYRGAPYLVKDQDGRTKCVSCQLCEFVCPPKAIRIMPPGRSPSGSRANVEKAAEGIRDQHAPLHLLRLCQEVCPEEAIFLMKDYSLTGLSRAEMIYDKDRLYELGGVRTGLVNKWNELK